MAIHKPKKQCNTGPDCGPVVLVIAATDSDGTVLDFAHFCAECAADRAIRAALLTLELTVATPR